MDDIHPKDERNPQTRFLNRDALELIAQRKIAAPPNVGTHLTAAHLQKQSRILCLLLSSPHQLVQLADLFLLRHLLKEILHALFERLGGVFINILASVFVQVVPPLLLDHGEFFSKHLWVGVYGKREPREGSEGLLGIAENRHSKGIGNRCPGHGELGKLIAGGHLNGCDRSDRSEAVDPERQARVVIVFKGTVQNPDRK